MNFLPQNYLFDGFLPEAVRTFDFAMVKCIRLSMRLLANLEWYRIETKKPKFVFKTPLLSIDRQVISVSYWHR
jgi:hypothetical protein